MIYIDTPCPCKEGDDCPHYGRKLVGRIWELTRMNNDLGRKYRDMWAKQVLHRGTPVTYNQDTIGPALQHLNKANAPKGCNCKGKK